MGAHSKEYYAQHKEELNLKQKEYYAQHKDEIKCMRKENQAKKREEQARLNPKPEPVTVDLLTSIDVKKLVYSQ
jgi:hypothetical protein